MSANTEEIVNSKKKHSSSSRNRRKKAVRVNHDRDVEKEVAATSNRGVTDAQANMIVDLVFDLVIKLAMKKFEGINLDATNITEFAAKIMELVEDFPIKGAEKKRVVLKVLSKFTDREAELIPDDNEEEIDRVEQVRFILIEVIPFAIDTMCAISKNEIVIDAAKKTKKWWAKVGCCGGQSPQDPQEREFKQLLEQRTLDKEEL